RARRLDDEVAYREALEGALRATLADRSHAVLRAPPRSVFPTTDALRPLPSPSRFTRLVGAARGRLMRGVARRLARRLWRR
ncbi:MAG TPA: hypothetical protein VMG12_16010, partial [Polyangiaceae bacterium]|nr:hypothetical protein [Polyangiaceae bacterium]